VVGVATVAMAIVAAVARAVRVFVMALPPLMLKDWQERLSLI
jgi:hypothetical protein